MQTIKLTSRASVKIKDNFYTFEACIEKTVPENIEEDSSMYEDFKQSLWDEVNDEVDKQIIETTNFILSKTK